MDRLNRTFQNFLYKKETFYLLNHITLKVKDPKIAQEIRKHRNEQFKKVVWPVFAVIWVSAIKTIYDFFVLGKGHPMFLVDTAINIMASLALVLHYFWGREAVHFQSIVYTYYVFHAITVVLVY